MVFCIDPIVVNYVNMVETNVKFFFTRRTDSCMYSNCFPGIQTKFHVF